MKIAISGTMTSIAAQIAKSVAPWFMARRHMLSGLVTAPGLKLGTCPPSASSGNAPNQQPRHCVYDECDQEQRQADLHQRTQVHVAGGFAELVCDHAGHGVARRKQRF